MNLDNILSNQLEKKFLIQLFQEQAEVHASAIEVALSNQQPQAFRATWILFNCTSKNDARIQPYVSDFILAIAHKKDGQQREILKILDKMHLNNEQEGKLFDICMNLWENPKKASALRYVSFKYIYKTCKKYPELNNELQFISQDHFLESLTPGIKKNIEKIIQTDNQI